MSRIIVFTGKGGVGKTSVAAAHARKASKEGKKTLIVSTDMAHNLGDLFEMDVKRDVTKVDERLYALEIDPYYEMKHDFAAMMDALTNMLPGKSEEKTSIEDLEMFPGIEELFSLLKIQEIYQSHEYDLMIVDCAPTGETLSLLKFPELLSWYMEKLFPVGKVAMKVMRPISKQFFQIQLPDGKAMNDIERMYLKLAQLQDLMKDREVCSIRLVTIPEKMVVEETKRNYMYLNLYNFNVDGVYINRILPQDVKNDFFDEWMLIQNGYIEELNSIFTGIPVYSIKWYDIDLNGLSSLDRVCEDALTDENLFEVKCTAVNEVYEKKGEGYELKVYLPCVQKDEIEMHEAGQDLIIKIGNFKRNIPLPGTMRSYEIQGAKMEGNYLNISFGKESADE